MKLVFKDKRFITNNSATICILSVQIKGENIPVKFTGVAKCHLDDAENYDIKKGEHIAESRAKAKAYKYALTWAKKGLKATEETLQYYKSAINNFDRFINTEENHIKELIDGPED